MPPRAGGTRRAIPGTVRRWGTALAAVGLAAAATAQTPGSHAADQPQTSPRHRSGPISPSAKEGSGVAPANPESPSLTIPGLEDADFRIGRASLRAEGTFLVERRASMLKLPDGEWVLIFAPDRRGRRERPMVLVPCQMLQRMEQMETLGVSTPPGTPGGGGGGGPPAPVAPPVFIISGQVLAYGSVNYLIPTLCRPAGPTPAQEPSAPDTKLDDLIPAVGTPADAGKAGPDENPPPRAAIESNLPEPKRPDQDPAVGELIHDLEAQRDARGPGAPNERTAGAAAAAATGSMGGAEEAPAAAGVLPEDAAILHRRGRMIRTAAGRWAFRFDSAPGGDPRLDRPMLLVPCLALQRMESWAEQRGEGASMEVSGRVLAYHGVNYLLPTMYQVYPKNDLEARQGP